ncbi:MAG: hypothetical protein ACRD8Z_01290 [Nitrososphaeraceae archaeon]
MTITESTISLQKPVSLEPDRQVKEIFIILNTEGRDIHDSQQTNNTVIRIGAGQSSVNPSVNVDISYNHDTKFTNMTSWFGEINDNPKIWLNHEDSFLKITCAYNKTGTPIKYTEDCIYMINTNDVAYVDIKY